MFSYRCIISVTNTKCNLSKLCGIYNKQHLEIIIFFFDTIIFVQENIWRLQKRERERVREKERESKKLESIIKLTLIIINVNLKRDLIMQ